MPSKVSKPQGPVKARLVLTETAIARLDRLARGADVFEFGSGGSTLWLAQRAARVVSVEDNPDWHKAVVAGLRRLGTPAEVRLVTTKRIPDAIGDTGLWDVVFVDCWTQEERRRSILLGAQHVRPGGWLVADDYDFPKVADGVNRLRDQGWAVEVIAGTKLHPVRKVTVRTSTAFCHKPEDACS